MQDTDALSALLAFPSDQIGVASGQKAFAFVGILSMGCTYEYVSIACSLVNIGCLRNDGFVGTGNEVRHENEYSLR